VSVKDLSKSFEAKIEEGTPPKQQTSKTLFDQRQREKIKLMRKQSTDSDKVKIRLGPTISNVSISLLVKRGFQNV